jgi:uncharacterized protein (DUF4415 family)
MNTKSIKKKSGSKTNWVKLHRRDDADIDYRDSPATNAEFWDKANVVMPQHKIHLSVRFDEDVVKYFKKGGRGYQSRMNAILKAYVNSHKKRA